LGEDQSSSLYSSNESLNNYGSLDPSHRYNPLIHADGRGMPYPPTPEAVEAGRRAGPGFGSHSHESLAGTGRGRGRSDGGVSGVSGASGALSANESMASASASEAGRGESPLSQHHAKVQLTDESIDLYGYRRSRIKTVVVISS